MYVPAQACHCMPGGCLQFSLFHHRWHRQGCPLELECPLHDGNHTCMYIYTCTVCRSMHTTNNMLIATTYLKFSLAFSRGPNGEDWPKSTVLVPDSGQTRSCRVEVQASCTKQQSRNSTNPRASFILKLVLDLKIAMK